MGPAGTDGLDLSSDARALVSHMTDAGQLARGFGPERGGYLYVIDGRATICSDPVRTGDAVKIQGPAELTLATDLRAELILIDVPLAFEPVGVWAGER
jgi:hypothetical protein